MAHLFLSLFLYPYNPRSCTSAKYACDCSCNLLDCKQGIAIVAGLPKRWSAEFQWFQWQLEETGKESWIKDSKRPQVQSTIPQPSLQDLCLTPSCSDNSTTACGNISLCWTIHSPGKFFLIFYLRLSCWSWSLSLALLEECTRTHCASLHQPCTYLASCFVSAWSPLQTTHFSLSQPFLKSRFSTPQLFFLHLFRLFPAELYLSRGMEIVLEPTPHHCRVEWEDCPMPSAVCPSGQASWQDRWIFAALDFCCTPKHCSPGSFSAR